MDRQRWQGLSVIYVCPLKALLNNLLPRLESYTALARPPRRALARGHYGLPRAGRSSPSRPTSCSPRRSRWSRCSSARTLITGGCSPTCGPIVVDEVHAFGGDDRGWHLLAVLERLTRIRGQADPADRTVGDRREPRRTAPLASGVGRGHAAGVVVAPETAGRPDPGGRGPFREIRDSNHGTAAQRARTSSSTTSGAGRTPRRSSPRCTGGEATRLLRLQAARRGARRAAAGTRRHDVPDPRLAVA